MNYKKIISDTFSSLVPLTENEEIIKCVTERAEKMSTKKTLKTRKPMVAVCAAVATMTMGAIVVAAESSEFNQFIYTTTGFIINPDKIIYAESLPQYPIDGFSSIEDIGKPIAKGSIKEDFPTEMYSVNLIEKDKNKFTSEKVAYGNGQTMILGDGFDFKENQYAKIIIDADFTAEYHTDQNGERVAIGYIYDNVAYEVFSGKTDGEVLAVNFLADKAGEYRFYITNYSAGLQNYDSVSVEVIDN